jgi:hypothetical protein
MDAARQARSSGNEGRARVCARRAAGHAIRGYKEAIAVPDRDHSAYALLRWLAADPGFEPSVRSCAERLAARVTPDHVLPYPEDPLADAKFLIEALSNRTRQVSRRERSDHGDRPDPRR